MNSNVWAAQPNVQENADSSNGAPAPSPATTGLSPLLTQWYRPECLVASSFSDAAWLAFFSVKIDCRSYHISANTTGLEVRVSHHEGRDAWDVVIALLCMFPSLQVENARPASFASCVHGQSLDLPLPSMRSAVEAMLFSLQLETHGDCRIDLNHAFGNDYELVDMDADVSGVRSLSDVCPTASDFNLRLQSLPNMLAVPEFDEQGIVKLYKYNYSKAKLQFVGEKHTYQIVSSTDGLCGFHALAFLLKSAPTAGVDNVALEEIFHYFSSQSPDGKSTNLQLTIAVARAFDIPIMHVDTFYQKFAAQNIKSLASAQGYQLSPAILYDAGHTYIAFSPRDQYRRIGDLTRFMQAALQADQRAPIPAEVIVTKRVKASKSKPTATKEENKSRGLPPLPKDLVVPLHSKGCACSKNMALFATLHRFGVDIKRPKVECVASAMIYASLRKTAHPRFFRKVQRSEPLVINDTFRPAIAFVSGRFKVVDGDFRSVDPKALVELGPNLVFSLTADSTPLDVLQAPLPSKPHISVEFDQTRPRFVANLRGQTMPRSALQAATSWSIPLTNLENKDRGRFGSAHAFARFMSNHCQALALNRLPCFQPEAEGEYTIVDVGAKFATLIPLLRKGLLPSFGKVFPPFTLPADPPEDLVAYARARSMAQNLFRQDPLPPLDEFMQLLEDELAVANSTPERHPSWTHLFRTRCEALLRLFQIRIRYIAIRPDVSPQDQTYWREHVHLDIAAPRLAVELHRCTLQQFAVEHPELPENTSLLFFDCHYYFSPQDFASLPPGYAHLTTFTAGMNFPTIDGHYTLPLGEGSCVVRNGGSQVDMNTRGGLEVYSHPNRLYIFPSSSFHSGWVTWFSDSTTLSDMSTRLRSVIGLQGHPGGSIQDEWMRGYALSLKGSGDKVFHSLGDVVRRFPRTFQPPTIYDGELTDLAFWCSRSMSRQQDPTIKELDQVIPPEPIHWLRHSIAFLLLASVMTQVDMLLYSFGAWLLVHYLFTRREEVALRQWKEVHLLLEDEDEQARLPQKWSDLLDDDAARLHFVAGRNTYGYQDTHVIEKPLKQRVKLVEEVSRASTRHGYYRYKEPVAPQPMNPVLSASQNNDVNLEKFYHCAISHPFSALKREGTRFSRYELTEESNVAVQSGHSVVSSGRYAACNGSQSVHQEFEWSHKALCNSYAGFIRYANTQATATDVASLRRTANVFWDNFFSKWVPPPVRSMFDYPQAAFPDQPGKAQKYLDNISRALQTGDLSRGPFVTMVKSGEVYFGPPTEAGMVFTKDDSRPRNIMTPQGVGYVISAAIQWMLWESIKAVLPGFIQGMTSEQLLERFESLAQSRPEMISFDGSAFESTQYATHRQMAEGEFLRRIRSWLVDVFSHPENVVQGMTPHEAADRYISLNTDFNVDIFVPCLDASAVWSGDALKTFYKYIRGSHRDYIPFRINGTMASGDPFTTLGNTFRNLIYIAHYCGEVDARGAAAGDDGVIFCPPGTGARVAARMRALTSVDKLSPSPTGQVLPAISVSRDWQDLEFCSKWFYHVGGRLSLTRDLRKLLTTKQWYSRKNAHLLSNPALHRLAILEGVRYEKASHLLEDIVLASAPKMHASEPEQTLISRSGVNKYAPLPTNYELERQVNFRLGLSILDLCQVLTQGWFVAGYQFNKL